MSRNPYFSHLPTWRNRQDLAFALDSLPHILSSITSTPSSSSRVYPSPPSSPSCTSYFSHSHSQQSSPNTQQQHYQRNLVAQHLRNNFLQFSTRAQAMGFLIDILRSMQSEPCECDLVQGCFCSPDGTVEDHSGLAPCYVCGEWYAEQVFCRDEETMEVYQVDGRSYHERGSSLRHHVEEARVRRWLDQVVVPPQPQPQQQERFAPLQRSNSMPTCRASLKKTLKRSSTSPTSFLIPKEILDPSCRSPGFRIKSKDTEPCATFSEAHYDTANQEQANDGSSSCSSNRFSFTSERFRIAIQQSQEKPSVTEKVTTAAVDDAIINTTSKHVNPAAEISNAAQACPSPDQTPVLAMNDAAINQKSSSLTGTEAFNDHENPICLPVQESNSLLEASSQQLEKSQFDFDSSNPTSLETSDSLQLEAETSSNEQVSVQTSSASVIITNSDTPATTPYTNTITTTTSCQSASGSTFGPSRAESRASWPMPSISPASLGQTLPELFITAVYRNSSSPSSLISPSFSTTSSTSHPWEPYCLSAGRVK